MQAQEKTESLFEYWVSFWPVAPVFGVRWRFAELSPFAWSVAPFAPTQPAEAPAQPAQAAQAAAAQAAQAAAAQAEDAARTADAVSEAEPVEAAPAEAAPEADETAPLVADAEYDAATAQAEGARPSTLFETRPDHVDDLKRIRGVGPKLETMLNELGVYTFEQVAEFSQAELAWIDANIAAFKGRPFRDDWTAQARELIGR